MTTVDPFLIPIPRAVTKMPEDITPEDVSELTATFEYLWKHLHDMWVRSGGANDNLDDIVSVIEGDPEAELPGGEDPVWEGRDWDDEVS